MSSIWSKIGKKSHPDSDSPELDDGNRNPDLNSEDKFYYTSSSGIVVGDDNKTLIIPNILDNELSNEDKKLTFKKNDFIPKAETFNKINELIADNKYIREKYTEDTVKIRDYYSNLLSKCENHYLDQINELKSKALNNINLHKEMALKNEIKLKNEILSLEDNIEELRDNLIKKHQQFKEHEKISAENIKKLNSRIETNNIYMINKLILSEIITKIELDNQSKNNMITIKKMKNNDMQQKKIREECSNVLNEILYQIELDHFKMLIKREAKLQEELYEISKKLKDKELRSAELNEEYSTLKKNNSKLNQISTDYESERNSILLRYKKDLKSLEDFASNKIKTLNERLAQLEIQDIMNKILDKVCFLPNKIHRDKDRKSDSPVKFIPQTSNTSNLYEIDALNSIIKDLKSQLENQRIESEVHLIMIDMVNHVSSNSPNASQSNSYQFNKVSSLSSNFNQKEKDQLLNEISQLKSQLELARSNIQTSKLSNSSVKPPSSPRDNGKLLVLVEKENEVNKEISKNKSSIEELKKKITDNDAELFKLNESRMTLPGQINSNIERRKILKDEIANWISEFKAQNNRDPDNNDKNQIRDKYVEFRNIRNFLSENEPKLESINDEIKKRETLSEELNKQLDELLKKLQESESKKNEILNEISTIPKSPRNETNDSFSFSPNANESSSSISDPNNSAVSVQQIYNRPSMVDSSVQVNFPDQGLQPQSNISVNTEQTSQQNDSTTYSSGDKVDFESQVTISLIRAEYIDPNQKINFTEYDDKLAPEEIIEHLEDQLFTLNDALNQIHNDYDNLVKSKEIVQEQLDTLIKEKRTDVVLKYQQQIEDFIKSETDLKLQIATLTSEKVRLDTKYKEAKERCETAEEELRRRDKVELGELKPNDEKTQLKNQVSKQREELINKTKSATAGWDAAAKSDEKLEKELQLAYTRGIQEERNKHKNDFDEINKSLEEKENKITELLVSIAKLEENVRSSETEKLQMKKEVEAMKLEIVDAVSGLQQMAMLAASGGGSEGGVNLPLDSDGNPITPPTVQELEAVREALDTAQDELITLVESSEKLERDLQMARSRNRIYEQLALFTGLTSGKVNSNQTSKSSYTGPRARDLEDAVQICKKAVTKGTHMWKSNKKDECYDHYLETCQNVLKKILTEELAKPLRDNTEHGKTQGLGNKQKGANILKKGIDKFLIDVTNNALRSAEEELAGSMEREALSQIENEQESLQSEVNKLLDELKAIDEDFVIQGYNKYKNPSLCNSLGGLPSTPRDIENNPNVKPNPEEETPSSLLQRAKTSEAQVASLKRQLAALISATATAEPVQGENTTRSSVSNMDSPKKDAQTAKSSALTITKPVISLRPGVGGPVNNRGGGGGGADPAELRKLQKKIKELEVQLSKAQAAANSGGGGASDKELKAAQKKIKDLETQLKRETKSLEMRSVKAETELQKIKNTYDTINADKQRLEVENKALTSKVNELAPYVEKAEKVATLESTIKKQDEEVKMLQEQLKKESGLRKKYKNELEDLKGAIRVYARMRPMAKYELEKGCKQVVEITSESSLKLSTSRGLKEYEFDTVFPPTCSQEEVFEDTKRLVESCLDGFNVCVFAYGQTGSGKTHTMTGSPDLPGLTPRAINEIFRLIDERPHCTIKVSAYFVELYNDNLVDLFWLLDSKTNKALLSEGPPKLDIKMDAKKMVYVRNVIIKEVFDADSLMNLFTTGNLERHVGSTLMNAQSSRSHSIFSILIDCHDNSSNKNWIGKLSLVDLAGSERADKTGAGAERLKEAQSINKSLSALGDVIAALSEGNSANKFIPYRNNKLTQLMQDSLGGNAKTLMFVNFSPADYNSDETNTSLQYASRVKKIVNNASKQVENEEIARLKSIIARLKAGQKVEEEETPEEPNNEGN